MSWPRPLATRCWSRRTCVSSASSRLRGGLEALRPTIGQTVVVQGLYFLRPHGEPGHSQGPYLRRDLSSGGIRCVSLIEDRAFVPAFGSRGSPPFGQRSSRKGDHPGAVHESSATSPNPPAMPSRWAPSRSDPTGEKGGTGRPQRDAPSSVSFCSWSPVPGSPGVSPESRSQTALFVWLDVASCSPASAWLQVQFWP